MTGPESVEPVEPANPAARSRADPLTRRNFAYLALVIFAGFLIIGLGGYGYINYVNDQRIEGDRRAAETAAAERARQGEITRKIICDMANAQVDVFTNPTGPVGEKALVAWQALATQFGCK